MLGSLGKRLVESKSCIVLEFLAQRVTWYPLSDKTNARAEAQEPAPITHALFAASLNSDSFPFLP